MIVELHTSVLRPEHYSFNQKKYFVFIFGPNCNFGLFFVCVCIVGGEAFGSVSRINARFRMSISRERNRISYNRQREKNAQV